MSAKLRHTSESRKKKGQYVYRSSTNSVVLLNPQSSIKSEGNDTTGSLFHLRCYVLKVQVKI